MAGILSKGITLSMSTSESGTYTVIPNLQEIPDLGGDVDQVDVTTLADGSYKYINGIKNYGALDFTFLYDNSSSTSNYRVLKDAEGDVCYFKVEFPDAITTSGNGTTFSFQAIPHVKINGAGVNAALQFTCSLALQSEITIDDAD